MKRTYEEGSLTDKFDKLVICQELDQAIDLLMERYGTTDVLITMTDNDVYDYDTAMDQMDTFLTEAPDGAFSTPDLERCERDIDRYAEQGHQYYYFDTRDTTMHPIDAYACYQTLEDVRQDDQRCLPLYLY